MKEGRPKRTEIVTLRLTEEERRILMDTREEMQKREIVRDYADAVGAERFRITVTEISGSGTGAFVYDRKNGGYEGKIREELLAAVPKLDTFAHYGKNIIVTPLSPDKHHILVDDLTPENLLRLKNDGYAPACVIESSPGNYQAIMTVPSMEGDTAKDRAAANNSPGCSTRNTATPDSPAPCMGIAFLPSRTASPNTGARMEAIRSPR